MSFKDKFLMRDVRSRLTPKQVALFKLVLWSVLMVFLVFFATHTVITAQILARWAPAVFPQDPFYQTLARALPFWYVFTIGLIIVMIARYAYRKLKPKSYRQLKQALNKSEEYAKATEGKYNPDDVIKGGDSEEPKGVSDEG